MSQFALNLPYSPVFLAENFIVAGSNRAAHEWVARWPDWNSHALIIYGDAGCGKSHLGHIWARSAQAVADVKSARDLKQNALIENIESWKEDELFHLLNIARENKYFLLLTAKSAPSKLPFTLPDLTSRLNALPAAHIAPPDDELLAAVMRKQFSDRQLKVDEEVISYLVPRIERSFAVIARTVEALDKQALAQAKSITVPFAKRVLGF